MAGGQYKNIPENVPEAFKCPEHKENNKKAVNKSNNIRIYDDNGRRLIYSEHSKDSKYFIQANKSTNGNPFLSGKPPASVTAFTETGNINTPESSGCLNLNYHTLHKINSTLPPFQPAGNTLVPDETFPNTEIVCCQTQTHGPRYLYACAINDEGISKKLPMVIDSGCQGDGVIARRFVEEIKFTKSINKNKRIKVTMADGSPQICETLNLWVKCCGKIVNLDLAILPECSTGALIGISGIEKIHPTAFDKFFETLTTTSPKPKNV